MGIQPPFVLSAARATCIFILLRTAERHVLLCSRIYCSLILGQCAFALAALVRYLKSHSGELGASGVTIGHTRSWVTQAFLSGCLTIAYNVITLAFMAYDLFALGAPTHCLKPGEKKLVVATFVVYFVFLIGYGNLTPKSNASRIVFMIYGLIGLSAVGVYLLSLQTVFRRSSRRSIGRRILALRDLREHAERKVQARTSEKKDSEVLWVVLGRMLGKIKMWSEEEWEVDGSRDEIAREENESVDEQNGDSGSKRPEEQLGFVKSNLVAIGDTALNLDDHSNDDNVEITSPRSSTAVFVDVDSYANSSPSSTIVGIRGPHNSNSPQAHFAIDSYATSSPARLRPTEDTYRPGSQLGVSFSRHVTVDSRIESILDDISSVDDSNEEAVAEEEQHEADTGVEGQSSPPYKHPPPRDPAEVKAERNLRDRTEQGAAVRVGFWSVVFWLVGAAVFYILEDQWSYLDSVYFTYVTLTTIGFGDLVPNSPGCWEFWTYYSLFQVALVGVVLSALADLIGAGGTRFLQGSLKKEKRRRRSAS
ncbi:Potassium channel [Gonapodya sp. JEL0774]|nr:Potassium channel [Gonapodya sp. JEL0774]